MMRIGGDRDHLAMDKSVIGWMKGYTSIIALQNSRIIRSHQDDLMVFRVCGDGIDHNVGKQFLPAAAGVMRDKKPHCGARINSVGVGRGQMEGSGSFCFLG